MRYPNWAEMVMRMAVHIRELRDRTGLTQKAFSEMYGIPVSTLRKWEQGEASPPDYLVRLLARTLPREEQNTRKIEGIGGAVFYYNPEKRSVMDQVGNEILIKEDLGEVDPGNLILYLEDLFEGFYEIQEKFNRDCRYDKQEKIRWSR